MRNATRVHGAHIFTPASSCEANENYWRKVPSVKRLVLRVIPEKATRLAAYEARRNTDQDAADPLRTCCYYTSVAAGVLEWCRPHVGESNFGRMPGYAYSALYEDLTIKTA